LHAHDILPAQGHQRSLYLFSEHRKERGCDIGILFSIKVDINQWVFIAEPLFFDFEKLSLDPDLGTGKFLGLPCAAAK
jgi:hypothetical protein